MAGDDTVSLGDAAGEASAPGGTIGRFAVLGPLGSGGMGVVVAAHDPSLDRKVAIKLLRPGSWQGEQGRVRLSREAQAMARVQHPNVAAVYDVGNVGEQLFIAMELIDGQTLAGWLRERTRTPREVVAMLAAAGRGLAAVHAAGLVHRDFKPDNVLVGSDGRPRVTDFGLASLRGGGVARGSGTTTTLSAAGTPAYMSPERARGEPGDARSDQFSYCVTLHEALYGQRPFAGDVPPEARRAPDRPPRRSDVPAWLFDIVRRGLAAEPSARWPNMTALLAALARDPAIARRRIAVAAALLVVAGTAVFGFTRTREVSCDGAREHLAGVWDDGMRAAVRRVFVATGLPFAADTFDRTRVRLDRYTQGWADMREQACRATHVEGSQSEALLDLRIACLDRRRGTLAALTRLWSSGVDVQALERAIDAADSLPALSECADARALTERVPLPPGPAAAARIEIARFQLDRVRALMNAERWTDAKTEAVAARAAADAIGWPPVRAEAAYELGVIYKRVIDPHAESTLTDAAALAGEAHDDRLAARALTLLVRTVAGSAYNSERALLVARLAEGAVERAGGGEELRGRLDVARAIILETQARYEDAKALLHRAHDRLVASVGPDDRDARDIVGVLARIASTQGDYATSRKLYQEDLAGWTALLGAQHPEVAIALGNMGTVLDSAGDYAGAIDSYQRALAIVETAFGPDSSRVGLLLGNLAASENQIGRYDDAGRHYAAAIAIAERALGPDHPGLAANLGNLSGLRVQQGRIDEGLALAERSLAIQIKAFGDQHPNIAYPLSEIGDALVAKGDYAGALSRFQRALELNQHSFGPDHMETLGNRWSIGNVRCLQHHQAEGAAMLRDAIPRLAKVIGAKNPFVGRATADLGRCLLSWGRLTEALATLDRALSISQQGGDTPGALAAIRFAHARALFASGHAASAITEARTAARVMAAGPVTQSDVTEARRWLAAHGAAP